MVFRIISTLPRVHFISLVPRDGSVIPISGFDYGIYDLCTIILYSTVRGHKVVTYHSIMLEGHSSKICFCFSISLMADKPQRAR